MQILEHRLFNSQLSWSANEHVSHVSFIFLRIDPPLVLLEQSFLALFLQLVLSQLGQCLNADSFENLIGEVVKGGDPQRAREIGDF